MRRWYLAFVASISPPSSSSNCDDGWNCVEWFAERPRHLSSMSYYWVLVKPPGLIFLLTIQYRIFFFCTSCSLSASSCVCEHNGVFGLIVGNQPIWCSFSPVWSLKELKKHSIDAASRNCRIWAANSHVARLICDCFSTGIPRRAMLSTQNACAQSLYDEVPG